MSIRVRVAHGIVADVAVGVQGLGIGEVGVGDGLGLGAPIRRHPAPRLRVVARTEVIQIGFRIPLLAGEFVVSRRRALRVVLVAEGQVGGGKDLCACAIRLLPAKM